MKIQTIVNEIEWIKREIKKHEKQNNTENNNDLLEYKTQLYYLEDILKKIKYDPYL